MFDLKEIITCNTSINIKHLVSRDLVITMTITIASIKATM